MGEIKSEKSEAVKPLELLNYKKLNHQIFFDFI